MIREPGLKSPSVESGKSSMARHPFAQEVSSERRDIGERTELLTPDLGFRTHGSD